MTGRLSLLALLTMCGVAQAGASTAESPGQSLYARLGGASTVTALVKDAAAHLSPQRAELETRICALAGGGCRSPDAALALSEVEFVALLEQLRSSMRTHGVPLAARNELLEALAPLRRELARH